MRRLGNSVAVVCLTLTLSASTVWADGDTDRFQAWARASLEKPYNKAPFPCADFWSSSGKDMRVVDMTPWAAAAGLRRGDHPVAYDGIPLADGTVDSDNAIWARMSRGEYVNVRVERAGKEIDLRLPCRDARPEWEASTALRQAVAEGHWQDCLNAVSRLNQVRGYASAGIQNIALHCIGEKRKSGQQVLEDEFSGRIHAWATKVIEESHYRPTGLAEVRGQLLVVADALEKKGHRTFAEDIRQQIAAFNQAPTADAPGGNTVHRVGTAFAVRPDGLLLTAFHVVKGAREILVSCPETGKVSAELDRFSESNDLAVLRLTNRRTPTYVGLADPKTASLGQPVFTVGYPAPDILGGEAKLTDGVISSLSVGGDAGYMQISVPVQPGNSGGALISNSGDVVGVVVATASAMPFLKGTGSLPQNVSWAVKGVFAIPLFDQPVAPPRLVDRSAVIRRAANATCFVTVSADE